MSGKSEPAQSHGPEVEVLKPLKLRKQMAEMVGRMVKRYERE